MEHVDAIEATYRVALPEPVRAFLASAIAARPATLSLSGFLSGTFTTSFTDANLCSVEDLGARAGIDDLEDVPWSGDYAGWVPLAILESASSKSPGCFLVVDTRAPSSVCLFDKEGWQLYPCAPSFQAFLEALPNITLGRGFVPTAPRQAADANAPLAERLRRADVEAAAPLLDELFALPEGTEKSALMRLYFELYPERRTGAWTKATLGRALAWLRTSNDAAFAPLLTRCLVSLVPEVSLLLARLDARLAKETLTLEKMSVWGPAVLAGLVALEGTSGPAFAKASELFAPYETLKVVKPKDAESIAFGAIAMAASRDPSVTTRVLPFARGEKVVGSVAKEHAAKVMRLLEAEGLA